MGDFTSEKEQKLLESEAEVSNTEDTNADEFTFEEISGFSDDDDNSDEEKKPKKKFHIWNPLPLPLILRLQRMIYWKSKKN